MSFDAWGRTIGVRTNDPGVLESIRAMLPYGVKLREMEHVDQLYSLLVGGSKPGSRLKRFHLFYNTAAQITRSLDMDQVLRTVRTQLKMATAEMSRRVVFLHAGVVGWKGRAIILPGRTMAGKSTLVKALVDQGARYFSDEFAIVNRGNRILPYATQLALRDENHEQHFVGLDQLGGPPPRRSIEPGLIIFTQYEADTLFRPRAITAGQAFLGLIRNTLLLQTRPRLISRLMRNLAYASESFSSKRGDAAETAEKILHMARR